MKIGILGGGFGLYGYAVAAHQNGLEVIVKEDYREKILARMELRHLIDQITFVKNDLEVLNSSENVIFALPPQIQFKHLQNRALHGKRIFLEKPLAPTLRERSEILEHLRFLGIEFSVGYLFPFTKWGSDLALDASSGEIRDLKINWKIPRPESSWKLSSESGGGIVNYYLIHLLKLLVDLKYDSLDLEFDLKENYCRLSSEQFDIELNLTENNQQNFEVSWAKGNDVKNFQLATPFGQQNISGFKDVRVQFLSRYLESSIDKQLQFDTETRISKLLFKLLS